MNVALISITIVGGVLVPIAVPVLLVLWLWMGRFSSRWHYYAALAGTALALALLFVVSRWDVLGLPARWIVPVAFLVGAASMLRRRRFARSAPARRRRFLMVSGMPLLLLCLLLVWALWGMRAASDAVELSFPLRGGTYYVLHGGAAPLLNYHGAFHRGQRHALDIVRLREDGRRAEGVHPANLEAYAIFGDTVYAPVDGRVLAVESSLADQEPPARDRGHPLGNHVFLEREGLVVGLLHLMEGSVEVQPGEEVRAGASLAQVGNSGFSSEPHLHIHVIEAPRRGVMSLDVLHREGRPVPVVFEGRYLVRSSRFP